MTHIYTHTYVKVHNICTHTITVGGIDTDETHTPLHAHTHTKQVGGPALHVSHSGISVALSQSKIVFMGLSPQRSDITASNSRTQTC